MASLSFGPLTIGTGGGGGGGMTSPALNTPRPTGTSALPVVGSSPFTSAQQYQLQNALSAAGIWDTIQGLGGDIWGAISKVLPKNADGSVDWGGALKDVGSWVKNNKDTILQGLSAYNNYERSQKSDAYAQKALEGAEKSYAAKQPLRDAGMAGLLNPQANTPDLSALRTQGQSGLGIKAPLPIAAPTTNLNNAQNLANGPMSPNSFTKPLPVAGTPIMNAPSGGASSPPSMRPFSPSAPTPLPVATGASPQAVVPPSAPITSAQSGLIRNGPKDKTYTIPGALPVATL